MLNWILQLDKEVFLYLNQLNSTSFDSLMLFISYNFTPGILIILYFIWAGTKKFKKYFILPFLLLLVTFGLSDSISTKLFKDNFKRLRPMHNPEIMQIVHTAKQGRGGGKFGFVSSHASNTFALSAFILLVLSGGLLRKVKLSSLLFTYSSLVSYSRIYLGKHYPLDIVCGAILGISIALVVFIFWNRLVLKKLEPSLNQLR